MHRYHRWSDDDLALAFAAGDSAAGEALLERYAKLVYFLADRYGADADAAEDIFSEVWLKLHQQIGNYEPRATFKAYLRTLVRSVLVDHHVRRGRAWRETASLDAVTDSEDRPLVESLADPLDLEATILQAETVALVQAAVDDLPERFREPVALYYRDGLSHDQIATQLGVPVNTVATRIHRGRERVRRQVQARLAD